MQFVFALMFRRGKKRISNKSSNNFLASITSTVKKCSYQRTESVREDDGIFKKLEKNETKCFRIIFVVSSFISNAFFQKCFPYFVVAVFTFNDHTLFGISKLSLSLSHSFFSEPHFIQWVGAVEYFENRIRLIKLNIENSKTNHFQP